MKFFINFFLLLFLFLNVKWSNRIKLSSCYSLFNIWKWRSLTLQIASQNLICNFIITLLFNLWFLRKEIFKIVLIIKLYLILILLNIERIILHLIIAFNILIFNRIFMIIKFLRFKINGLKLRNIFRVYFIIMT